MTIATEPEADGDRPASRRGPMRPLRLVSVRANQSKRLSSHVFRTVDLFALLAVTLAVIDRQAAGSLLSTPLSQTLPFFVGAARARPDAALDGPVPIRAQRGHRRAPRAAGDRARHDAAPRVFATEALIDGGPSTVGLLDLGRRWPPLHWWRCTARWWLTVRTWRAAGWLTPNLVVVGATEYAEHLISDALARRHVNVLGVFDDRLERSPSAVLGVPVLGDIDALLDHKITPYVDRIVIAVEPDATKRVREIAARLAILPNEVILFLAQDDSTGRTAALARLEDSPLADLNGAADVDRKAFAKRVQDLLIGAPILLLVLAPFLALIALADQARQPRPGVLPPAPPRLQQRRDRGLEVPLDARRRGRRASRAPGQRRTTTGSPGSGDSCARPAWTNCRS